MWLLTATIGSTMSLTNQQILFVQEYCKDFNGTQAAIRAQYAEPAAAQQASRLLSNVKIKALIEERKQEIAAIARADCAWVLRQWLQIATADPNELVQLRRHNCRHCHGFAFGYQWTESQYQRECDKAIENKKDFPELAGGFGYDVNGEPNPECPECGGLGTEYQHITDTRKLKGSAKLLYGGIQKTKDGLKVVMRDQDAAVINIAKYLGMHIDRKEISGPGGGPVPMANLTASDLTDDQLAALIAMQTASEDDKPT